MANVQRQGAGRPGWTEREWPDRNLKWGDHGLLDLLRVRSRALLAATFAEGCWTDWPLSKAALLDVLAACRKILSLFIQAEATVNNDKPRSTLLGMRMTLEYSGLAFKKLDFSLGDIDSRAGERISFAVRPPRALGLDGLARFAIFFSVDPKAHTEARAFIENELRAQLNLEPSLDRFYPREGFGRLAPRTTEQRLWDARVRFSDFARRFLTVYRNPKPDDLNPFVAFFLKPRAYDGRDAAHIRSGFFGYQYEIDEGQKTYLKGLSQEVLTDSIYSEYVHFPEGLCSEIFLSGRAATAYTNDILAAYQQSDTTFSRLERSILRADSLLLEIPIFETGLTPRELSPDGPERIIGISFPTGQELNSEVTSSHAAPAQPRLEHSAPPKRSGLASGETQAIFEMTQRLVTRYVTLAPHSSVIGGLVGDSEAMRAVQEIVQRYALQAAGVLIRGESGTGKEVVATALHQLSLRPADRWKAVHLAGLPEDLAGSELFGHVKGSFTGAINDRLGAFDIAKDGTVFIDEVGDLTPRLQSLLLRVLEDPRQYSPVGSGETKPATARVVSATNKDLLAMVAAGTFREDLYYRIAVLEIELPALRDRLEDVPLLVGHLLRKHGRVASEVFDESALGFLSTYTWPGNVRQLRNTIDRAVAEPRTVTEQDLAKWLKKAAKA
jgi:hypothetical protein